MIAIILQARLGSTRLPNKVLMELPKGSGVTVLERCIEQCLKCDIPDEVVLTTPDRELAGIANKMHIPFHIYKAKRDVLQEYYQVARYYNVDIIARVTADCPLVEPEIIDNCIDLFLDSDVELVYNTDCSSGNMIGDGLDCEVFSYKALKEAKEKAMTENERMNVTPYIRNNMKTLFCPAPSFNGCSIDTISDYIKVCNLWKKNVENVAK